jgi:hypothetical protein
MAIVHTPAKIHWAFFTALEQDIEVAARYVEPQPKNYGTFSIEMCRVLFAASSECEVVLKGTTALFGVNSERFNIEQLREEITKHVPDLVQEEVSIPRYGLTLDPWSNWKAPTPGPPDWWTSYNRVKHQRGDFYEQGNLQNALNATAALMVATVYFYHAELSAAAGTAADFRDVTEKLVPESRVFRLNDKRYRALLALM